jgi:hypothetical protein
MTILSSFGVITVHPRNCSCLSSFQLFDLRKEPSVSRSSRPSIIVHICREEPKITMGSSPSNRFFGSRDLQRGVPASQLTSNVIDRAGVRCMPCDRHPQTRHWNCLCCCRSLSFEGELFKVLSIALSLGPTSNNNSSPRKIKNE